MAELNLECLAPGQGTLRHGVPNKREPGASIMGPLNDLVAERLPRVELAEVLIEVDSWTGFTQFFRHAGGARSRNPDLVRHGLRGDPGPGLQLRPHDEGRHRRFDLPPARRDHGLVPARGDAQSGLLGLSWTSSTSCLLPRPGAVEPSPPPMASDSPFEARRRTRPRSRNISASEGASLSTPGPRTSTRSTGRRSSRLRFVTRPMSSTRSSITRPIFRSSSTPRTPLATPRSSSPCFIFWGCSSPPASGTWALSAGIVSMLLRRKEGIAVLLKGLVRSKTLLDNWDELLRVAGSLKLGWVTASLLISKLQAGARENVLSRALRDLGRLVKTQFILRWIENPDYRRRIHRQLNKGEAPPRTAPLPILRSRREGTAPSSRSADESGPLPKLGHECHRHLEHRLHERRHRTAAGRGEDRPRHRSRPSVACPLRARQSLR